MGLHTLSGNVTSTKPHRLIAALVLFFALLGSHVSYAQVRSATLAGTVQDAAGKVVVGANVSILETSTSQTYTAKSNGDGNFTVPYLPGGNYTVTVVQPGFDTASQNNIVIVTGDSIHLNISLKVGTAKEVVTVSTEASGIQVDSPVVQSVIGEVAIAALPNISHNPLSYVSLEAGINTRGTGSNSTNPASFGIGINGRRQISDFAINGGQAYENDIQLDGLSTQSPGFNEVTEVPNQDAIQEVRALVNDYSAQYGRAHGLIAETTKGGTDQFHGLLFMRNRSSALAANGFNGDTLGIAKQASEIWTYGGTIGGPIKRGKAFFFGSFEGLHYDNPRVFIRTVPTAAERIGDFSQSVVNVNGVAVPYTCPVAQNPCPTQVATLYDPFNATLTGPNVYTRAAIAGANTNNSAHGTNQYALNVLKNYPCAPTTAGLAPCTNRKPDDLFNSGNYQSTGTQTYRKANVNARIDYHVRANNFLYITGGYTHGDITNPLIWDGKSLWNPVVSAGDERFIKDRNPYVAIGDTQILSPTLVLDLRYSVSRVDTQDNSDLVPSNFDYSSLGISAIDQANNPLNVVPSFTVSGGSNWTAPNNNQFYNKHEHQTDHVLAGSMTKTAGRWTYKFGGEFRAYLANYTDSQTSFIYNLSSTFTNQMTTASGGVVTTPTNNTAADGGNPWASFLLGAGSVGIPPGQAVHPAFLHQYAALFTQDDWHPNAKLTINLGLRWDWQPGIAERYGKVSSIDLNATNPFGGKGGIYFPDANGNNKRMWDTDWSNFQPRVGFAYSATANTVVRGGVGVTFLPSNSGFFDGPYLFGSTSFDPYTNSQPYGFGTQNGVPVGTFDSAAVNQFVPATNANTAAPGLYGGVGGPRFPTRNYRNPYVYQGNLHIQQAFGAGWSFELGYNVEVGKRLPLGSSWSPNSDQLLSDSLLQTWRANYISRNGTGNTGSDQVPNPFQPNPAALIPFAGNLGKATMPLDQTLWAYPYLGNQIIQQNRGFSTYHALQASVRKDLSRGLVVGSNFTWSRSLGVDGGTAENNFAGEGTANTLPNLRNIRLDKRLSANDTPIRFAGYAVYDLPFGKGKAFAPTNRFIRGLVSGYRVSGTYIWQSGVPQQISMGSSLNGLADRNGNVPFQLPKSFQHFYDGKTSVVLPYSGRTITPCAHCFLKYNSDAFIARTTVGANGKAIPDIYYFGNASTNYGDIRTDPVDNVTMSLEREFRVHQRYVASFQINATNVLNHTQFAPNTYNGGVGNVQVGSSPSTNNLLGYGNNASFGTHTTATLDPRLIELQARFSF
jgi:hypothetical protein